MVPRVGGGAALGGVVGMALGVGYVCAKGVVDGARGLWEMHRVVKKNRMPIWRVPQRLPVLLVMLTGVFQVMRPAMVRLALPMVRVLQAV